MHAPSVAPDHSAFLSDSKHRPGDERQHPIHPPRAGRDRARRVDRDAVQERRRPHPRDLGRRRRSIQRGLLRPGRERGRRSVATSPHPHHGHQPPVHRSGRGILHLPRHCHRSRGQFSPRRGPDPPGAREQILLSRRHAGGDARDSPRCRKRAAKCAFCILHTTSTVITGA